MPRLQDEPSGLRRFRNATADRDMSDLRSAWDYFRRRRYKPHRELLEALVNRQQGLCMYCEQRLTDREGKRLARGCEVEHVIPKSTAPERLFDWTNMGASCHPPEDKGEACGCAKGCTSLAAKCDPRGFPVCPMVVKVRMDGRIIPDAEGCEKVDVSPDQLEQAIEILKLNREPLTMARRRILNEMQSIIDILVDPADDEYPEKMKDLAMELLGPDPSGHLTSFWTTVRCAMGSYAEKYIAKNEHLFA
ncbi:MAG: TIGR02646 family protein [Polyangiaceae bacterium]|nr:TIGR02646 family protein [Polyangiaceae bacterium]